MMNLFDKKFVYFEWDNTFKGKKVLVGDSLQLMRKEINDGVGMLRCVKDNDSDLYPFKDDCGTTWALIYYDPNYSCKVAYEQGKTIQYKSKDFSWPWIDCLEEPSWCADFDYRVKPEEPVLRVYKCSDDTLHISKYPYCGFLFEGTEEECKQYIKEHYCDRCSHQSCDMVMGTQFCKGFKEQVEVKKRRMTYRELAKWIMQGNGQVKHRDGNALNTFNTYDVRDDDKPCPDEYIIRGWDETEWSEPLIEE